MKSLCISTCKHFDCILFYSHMYFSTPNLKTGGIFQPPNLTAMSSLINTPSLINVQMLKMLRVMLLSEYIVPPCITALIVIFVYLHKRHLPQREDKVVNSIF